MKETMGFFNDYAITNNEMHPVAKLFYNAMQACENLPASEEQTATIIAIEKCKERTENYIHASSLKDIMIANLKEQVSNLEKANKYLEKALK